LRFSNLKRFSKKRRKYGCGGGGVEVFPGFHPSRNALSATGTTLYGDLSAVLALAAAIERGETQKQGVFRAYLG